MNLANQKSRFLFATHFAFVAVFAVIIFSFIITPASAATEWHIRDDATGGDCILIGNWDIANKACTLTQDLNQGIIIDSDNIILDGNGRTITGSNTGNGVYLAGRTGVTIKNLNVKQFSYGIYLYSSSGDTLTSNTVNSNRNIGIYLIGSSNNTLTSNTASSNGNGIILYSSSNNTLTSNTANSNGYGGITLSSSSNNALTGNTVNSNNGGGIYFLSSNNNTLTSNTVSNNLFYFGGIRIESSSNNILISNIIQENYSTDVRVFASLDSHCDNSITDTIGSGGKPIKYFSGAVNLSDEILSELILCNADGSSINNVIIDGSATKKNNGLFLIRTDYSTITNVNSSNNSTGIELRGSNSNTLTNNSANSNYSGIRLGYSSSNTLTSNTASSNGYGIYLDYSNSNTLTNNSANSNYSGIRLGYSSSNTLTSNTASSNGYGIYLDYSSSNNKIYNNNFINNPTQAYVSGGIGNVFNLAEPTGGNYWSSFDEPVEGCTDANSDSFCDIPYIFTGGQDNLPWTKKDGWLVPVNTPPTLSYSQKQGYESDSEGPGVEPNEGIAEETSFVFRIVYTDVDNDPPVETKLILSTLENDNFIPYREYDLVAGDLQDTNYTDGKEYFVGIFLPQGKFRYYFRAGQMGGPVVLFPSAGDLKWVEVGTNEIPIPDEVLNAEDIYYIATKNALEETTLIYSEMVADTAKDTAYILIDKYLEDALDKLLKVDETAPLREQTKKKAMKELAELATSELKYLAPNPTSITTSVVATVMKEVFLVDMKSPAPHPKFYEIAESDHLKFIETKLTNNPAEDSIDVSIRRLDALRVLAGHTADDVKTFKIGTFDVIEKLQEAKKKANFWLKLGGAVFLGKAIVVPVSAPVNLPVGTSMLSVSTGLDVLSISSEIGEWFMLMHIFGDVYLSELQTVRLYTMGLEGTISTLNTGEFPQADGMITTLIAPQEVVLNSVESFGGILKNTGDVTIDGRLVISITDPYGEVRKYTTDTKRISPQDEISLTTEIPFHGTPLIIGGETGEHSVIVKAEYGVLGFEKSDEASAMTFDVVYEPSPFVKTIIDNIKSFGEFTVGIQLTNNGKEGKTYTIVDEIPKEIAPDLTNIQFSRQPDEILDPDPIVSWSFNLMPGESIVVQYKVANLSQGLENELSYPRAVLFENGNSKDSVRVILDNNSALGIGGDSLGMLLEQISSLPDFAFGERPKQKRDALISKAKEVIKKVESAEFTDAVNKLTKDIRPKIDGQPNPQDWITDEDARTLLLRLVDDAVMLIGLLR